VLVARGETMLLEVRLFGGLERFVPGARFGQPIILEIADGLTCGMLLDKLGIPVKDVAIVLVNGVNRTLKDALCDGDRISFFPSIGGG